MKYSPDKQNIQEPVMSPMRKRVDGISMIKRLLKWRKNRRHFKIKKDWIIWIDYLELWIKIPSGFVLDGASVPKAFHSVINSIDALFYGSIIHDFIYRTDQLIVCSDKDFGNWKLMSPIGKTKTDRLMFEFTKQTEGYILPNGISLLISMTVGWLSWIKARKRGYKLLTPYPSETNSILNYYN